jgi:outer membrane protein
VFVSAGYNTSFSSAADIPFADQLDQRRGGSVSIGVSLPIFDRGSTDLASQRARIAADNARIALENQRQQVGLEVRRAYLDYQSARQQLQAAEAQQRAAALALESTQQRYDVGAATLLEVTQARASQVQATSALVSARYDLLLQRTVMDYYAGDLDPRNVTLG